MIDVIAGVGPQKDFSVIAERVGLVAPYIDWVQIDFADNTLVPNETILTIDKFASFTTAYPKVGFEAHLMVGSPEKYVKPLSDAGFRRLIAHIECHDPRRFLEEARFESVEVGLAIDGPTEFEQLEPYLDSVDFVLVMTIEAGFSGSPFMPETAEKIRTLHRNLPDLPIEVDGGINADTARVVRDAGATRLVSTTFLYQDPKGIQDAIRQLKGVS